MSIAISTIAAVSIGGPARFSCVGDSITADGGVPSSLIFTNWGYTAWFRRFMGRRIDFPLSRMYAVAGSKVIDVVNNQLPTAAADASDVVIVHIGTNSIGVETDAAIQSGMQTIFDTLRAAGKLVVAIPVRAHRAAYAFTAQQKQQVGKINRWVYQYSRINANMLYFSFDPLLQDWSTGDAQAAYLRDGLHDNLISAKLLGKALSDFLSPLIPSQDGGFTGLGDVYDATFNPTGNLLTNGLLAGAGGTLANGATGTPPTSWRGRFGGAAITSTLAFSKVADATYPTLSRAVMTIGGTGDGNNCVLDNNTPTLASLGVSVGDVVELEAEIAWNFTTGAFQSLWLEVNFVNGSFAFLTSSTDGAPPTNGSFAVGESGSAFYRTPPLVVPAGAIYNNCLVTVVPPASGACAGTITSGRVALRKVS
jgi:hypothetical protein